MKKTLFWVGVVFILVAVIVPAYAENGIIRSGRTLIPVRGVFEELGFNVEWNSLENKAVITDGNHAVSVIKGANFIKADGNEIFPDVPQQVISGKLYLPLRAVSDAVGANIEWDNNAKTAYISYNGKYVSVKAENEIPAVSQTAPSTAVTPAYESLKSASKETIVYIGNTGTKYHNAGCPTLKGNDIPITLSEALSQGREPCKVCHR